jgi:3-hydroxy-9,10-secoandrosta-1,3,5(10)-triene-9,17-dione monooxygenase reductase component
LSGALAWLDCRVQTLHDGSTHWIIIGEVIATGHKDDAIAPLIYFNRAYYALAPEGAQP